MSVKGDTFVDREFSKLVSKNRCRTRLSLSRARLVLPNTASVSTFDPQTLSVLASAMEHGVSLHRLLDLCVSTWQPPEL